MSKAVTRRLFINQVAAGATAAIALPRLARPRSANGKLNVGFVAVGGRAGAHTRAAHREGCQCIAFAEVDRGRWKGVLGKEGWGDEGLRALNAQGFNVCSLNAPFIHALHHRQRGGTTGVEPGPGIKFFEQ